MRNLLQWPDIRTLKVVICFLEHTNFILMYLLLEHISETVVMPPEDVALHRKPKFIPKLNRVWKKSDHVTTPGLADKSSKLKTLKKKVKPKSKM